MLAFDPLTAAAAVPALQRRAAAERAAGADNSDVAYLLILTVFAITNGYASTLIMMASLGEDRLEKEEIDVAATICSLYLTSGLAAGSLASFPVRAFVCQCNPF